MSSMAAISSVHDRVLAAPRVARRGVLVLVGVLERKDRVAQVRRKLVWAAALRRRLGEITRSPTRRRWPSDPRRTRRPRTLRQHGPRCGSPRLRPCLKSNVHHDRHLEQSTTSAPTRPCRTAAPSRGATGGSITLLNRASRWDRRAAPALSASRGAAESEKEVDQR
ncbi:hypothetical protein BC828DRAFT_84823 [Blastocladiella britannica]|nr:hypothetical protein BC828DRAFT_84823 [Blastocladiella britannica]